MKLDDIKQELWVSKERSIQQTVSQNYSQSYKDQNQLQVLHDVRQPSNRKKEKLKSNTLKKASKKIFNEDLVEIGEAENNRVSSRAISE